MLILWVLILLHQRRVQTLSMHLHQRNIAPLHSLPTLFICPPEDGTTTSWKTAHQIADIMKVSVDGAIFLEGLSSLPRRPDPIEAWARTPAMGVYRWESNEVEATDKDKREWQQTTGRSISAENAEELENQVTELSWTEQHAIQDTASPAMGEASNKAT